VGQESCGTAVAVGQGKLWGRGSCGSRLLVGQESCGAGRAVGLGYLWGRDG